MSAQNFEKRRTMFAGLVTSIQNEIAGFAKMDTVSMLMGGSELRRRVGYGIPTNEALDCIRKTAEEAKSGILAVGSGHFAFVETLLSGSGSDIVATDIFEEKYTDGPERAILSPMKVEKLDSEAAVAKYPERHVLLMVWPHVSNDMDARAITAVRKRYAKDDPNAKRARIIVQGEGGGSTLSSAAREELESNWARETELYWDTILRMTETLDVYRLK